MVFLGPVPAEREREVSDWCICLCAGNPSSLALGLGQDDRDAELTTELAVLFHEPPDCRRFGQPQDRHCRVSRGFDEANQAQEWADRAEAAAARLKASPRGATTKPLLLSRRASKSV